MVMKEKRKKRINLPEENISKINNKIDEKITNEKIDKKDEKNMRQ